MIECRFPFERIVWIIESYSSPAPKPAGIVISLLCCRYVHNMSVRRLCRCTCVSVRKKWNEREIRWNLFEPHVCFIMVEDLFHLNAGENLIFTNSFFVRLCSFIYSLQRLPFGVVINGSKNKNANLWIFCCSYWKKKSFYGFLLPLALLASFAFDFQSINGYFPIFN